MIKKIVGLYPPVLPLLNLLTFFMGAGIARYLGYSLKILVFILGLTALLSFQAAAFLLVEYFRLPLQPRGSDETLRQRERYRITILQVSYAAMTLSIVLLLVLIANHAINFPAAIIFILAILLMVVFSVPPIHLSEGGYGELIQAIFMGMIVPSFGFLLQYGGASLHRLLTFITFPLTLLALAFLLIRNFPTYATDQKLGRKTLLIRLTWQYAIPIHHVLILVAYLFFSLASFVNIPWGVVWPVFLALPFGIVQVIWLQRIARGGPAHWNILKALSTTTFGLSVYLLALTFWIR